jgi:hypothetical protein
MLLRLKEDTSYEIHCATLLDEKISHFAIIGDACRCGIHHDIINLPERPSDFDDEQPPREFANLMLPMRG